MFGEDPKKRAIYAPLDESCHPELDDSPLCNEEDKRKHVSVITRLPPPARVITSSMLGTVHLHMREFTPGGGRKSTSGSIMKRA